MPGPPTSSPDRAPLARWAARVVDGARAIRAPGARRAELERSLRTARTAMDIATAVGDDTDLPRVLDLIATRARALVEADTLLIWLRDGELLRLAAQAGTPVAASEVTLPLEGSTTGEALRTGRPVRIEEAARMRVTPRHFGMPDARTALAVPLAHRGRGLGVLVAFDRLDGERFDGEDERALSAFAASAATAVATARSVEQQRLRDALAAAESERHRWARELHDATLQGLASLKLALAGALRADDAEIRRSVELAVAQLDDEVTALREVIADLRPAALDELGLEPALRTLVARAAATAGLEASVTADEGPRLDAGVEVAAYRVAQEALTNVVKHAGATRVDVELRRRSGRLTLTVADDGVGIAGPREGGYGLTGMRERAAMAEGELVVGTGSALGTQVTLVLPLALRTHP